MARPARPRLGSLVTQSTNEEPRLGNTDFFVEGSGYPSGTQAFMIVGTDPGFTTIPLSPPLPPGCSLHSDVVLTISGAVRTGVEAGHLAFALPIPQDPALAGAFISTQMAALDMAAQASFPVVTSNALRFRLF